MKIRARTALWVSAAVLGSAAVLAPAVAAAASGSQTRSASAVVPPPCETPGLVIWFNPNGNAAAGTTAYHLLFTNLSGHQCTLNGYPYLFAVNLRGLQVGRIATHPPKSTHAITLNKGGTVHVVLRILDVLNIPPTQCHRVTAAGFKVYPPNQTRAKTVPYPFPACTLKQHTFLSVSGLTKGF